MVWLIGVLSILFFFFCLAFFLNFKIVVDLKYPFHLDLDLSLHFLGLKKNFSLMQLGNKKVSQEKDHSQNQNSIDPDLKNPTATNSKISIKKIANINTHPSSFSGQRGFVLLPTQVQNKFKSAGLKFLVEIPVWKIGLSYVLTVIKRIFLFMHLRLEKISLGLKDVNSLGTIAAYWSSISGVFPKLQSPIEYHFNEPDLRFQIRIRSKFNLLQILLLVLMVIFTLPWFPLLAQFIRCWRNPGLNLWQRTFTTLVAR